MTKTQALIDKFIEQKQGDGFRKHLGASIIGRACARDAWYTWRWATRTSLRARILRLFDRGNREEERITKWLRQAGIHVVTIDPETGKQYRIEDFEGHFGGSLDASIFDAPDVPGLWILGEYKTHNDKSFKEVKRHGVKKAKPEHHIQMQIYMHYKKYPAALYFAVNKNDDEMYIELITYDAEVALKYIERAGRIIQSRTPPKRINESPGWYVCQLCDHKGVCHNGDALALNCRTCIHSRPIEGAQWLCEKYNYILSDKEQKSGCQSYTAIS